MNPVTQISESVHMDWLIKSQRFGISHLVLEVIAPHIVEDLLQVEVLDKEGQLIPGLAAHYEAVVMRHLLKVFPAKRQAYSLAHHAVIAFYQSMARSMALHAATHKAPSDQHEVATYVVKGFALLPFQYVSATFLNSFQNYLKNQIQFTGSLADAVALDKKMDVEIKKAMGKDKTFGLLRVVTHLEVLCGADYFREIKKEIKADKEVADFLSFLWQSLWSGKSVGYILAELQFREKNDKPFAMEFQMVWHNLRVSNFFTARRLLSAIPLKEIKEFEKAIFE